MSLLIEAPEAVHFITHGKTDAVSAELHLGSPDDESSAGTFSFFFSFFFFLFFCLLGLAGATRWQTVAVDTVLRCSFPLACLGRLRDGGLGRCLRASGGAGEENEILKRHRLGFLYCW